MTFYLLDFFAHFRDASDLLSKILRGSLAIFLLLGLAPQEGWTYSKSSMQTETIDKAAKREVVLSQRPTAVAQPTFIGKYRATTPDGQKIVTYFESGERFSKDRISVTRLYDLEGIEQAAFEGEFQGFAIDRQGLITYLEGQSYLYSFDGTRRAVFKGAPVSYTPDRKGILVVDDFGSTVRMIGGIFPLGCTILAALSKPFSQGILYLLRQMEKV